MLLTVFRADSIEKINIWGAKSAYSATENSYNIEKKNHVASCVACVLCLFLTVLWVCLESAIEVFSSHSHFMNTILSS